MQRSLVSERLGGSFLIAYALLSLVAIAHHPQVAMRSTSVATFQKVASIARPDEVMHGAIIVLLLLLAFGFVVLGRARGFERPAIIAASLCAAVGIAAPIAAGSIDGFWVPWFASRVATEQPQQIAMATPLLTAAGIFIQIASKFGFVGIALAIAMYSADFFRGMRAVLLGCYGLLAGMAVVVMLSTIASRLTPHTLLFPMALQAIWFVVAGTLLARGRLTNPDGRAITKPT